MRQEIKRPDEGHRTIEELENYSLGRLDARATENVEDHLLICPDCIERLAALEPHNFVHYTKEGPFYSRITRLRNGRLLARHWSRTQEGGKQFLTMAGARKYLARSFSQMFPDHVCTARCGSTGPGQAK